MLSMIEKLLVLQDRDRKIRQLQKENEDIPARKKLIESRLQEYKQNVQASHDAVKKNASAAKQLELDIESHKQRILKFREQQGQIKTNEQYRALEEEIKTAHKQIREVEDREIVLMEESETLKAQAAQTEQRLKQEESVIQSDIGNMDQRIKNNQAEIAKLQEERKTLTTDIDPDWLGRYERVFKHTGDYALVPIENAGCGGCHMKIQPQLIQDVKRNQNMISCTFCGRVLYWRP